MAMRSADQEKIRPVAKVGTSAARNPGRGEDQIGDRAEQPGRVVGQHHLLAQQPDEVAIRLDQRRTLAAHQPRLDLAHEADEQRRQRQNQQHLRGLDGEGLDHGHIASTRRRPTSEAKTKPR